MADYLRSVSKKDPARFLFWRGINSKLANFARRESGKDGFPKLTVPSIVLHSNRRRASRSGIAKAGVETDFGGGLLGMPLRLPAKAQGPRRNGRDRSSPRRLELALGVRADTRHVFMSLNQRTSMFRVC